MEQKTVRKLEVDRRDEESIEKKCHVILNTEITVIS